MLTLLKFINQAPAYPPHARFSNLTRLSPGRYQAQWNQHIWEVAYGGKPQWKVKYDATLKESHNVLKPPKP